MEQELKQCPRCGEPTPLSELYTITRTRVSGKVVTYYTHCKPCNRAMAKKGYKKNPERRRELTRKWALENPEKKRAAEDRWHKKNSEKMKASYKKWYSQNKEHFNNCRKIRRQKSRDEISDSYLISVLRNETGLTPDQIRANPLLMEQKRQSIKNYREKKEQKKNKA